MKNITTDKFAEMQARISLKLKEAISKYPSLWAKMISKWKTQDRDDAVWLMYSANYLVRTAGVRWAIDPLSLNWRIPGAPKMDLCSDLQDLSFVLLTHSHNDHLDFDLLCELSHLPIRWIIPKFLIALIQEKVRLPGNQIVVPHPLKPIEFQGFRIVPFEGQHLIILPDGKESGVPEMGYLVEFKDKRWLFPGDTRIYSADRFPAFGDVNALFAHLWLGRGAALDDLQQMIDAFCQFCADLKPERIILAHIEELGRDAGDFWDDSHINEVLSRFQIKFPSIPIVPVRMGEFVSL